MNNKLLILFTGLTIGLGSAAVYADANTDTQSNTNQQGYMQDIKDTGKAIGDATVETTEKVGEAGAAVTDKAGEAGEALVTGVKESGQAVTDQFGNTIDSSDDSETQE